MGEQHFSFRRSPSPTSCCQLQDPCPEGPMVGRALEAPLSQLAEFCGVGPGFAEFPLQWLLLEWAPGRVRGCMGCGEHGSSSLQVFPKQAKKYLISTLAKDLNNSSGAGKIYVPLKWETKWGSSLFLKVRNAGDNAEMFRCSPGFSCWGGAAWDPWELCGSGAESFAPGKTHDKLYILGICDPFLLHCAEVCHWEAILHFEIPYLGE